MLEIRELVKSFPQPDGSELRILDVSEFEVGPGEQVVVVGRSGCGKTTLLHVIAGISRPTSGRVKIDGWDLAIMEEAEVDRFRAERIGYVFQTFNLLPSFTALENVLLGMTFGSVRPEKDRARHLLERVGLEHRLTHKPTKLSVGEQQRVAVARAVMQGPRLLLADEPTGNLDPGTGDGVQQLLLELNREHGMALVVATHNERLAAAMERTLRLADGRLHDVRVDVPSRRGSAGGSAS
jgi:putative ABC transport system ATP-binding protein